MDVYFCCFYCQGLILSLSVAILLKGCPSSLVWKPSLPFGAARSLACPTGPGGAVGWELVPAAWHWLPAGFSILGKAENAPIWGCFSGHLDKSPRFPFHLLAVCFRKRFGRWCPSGWLLQLLTSLVSAVLERSGYRSSVHHWKSAQPHVGPDPKGSFKIGLPAVGRLKESFVLIKC